MSKQNGHVPSADQPALVPTDVGIAVQEPRLDPARRVFTTSEGTDIALRPVRALIVERLANSTAGKPKVPDIEVVIAGRTKRLEPNPADEDYLKALREWEQKKNFDVNFFLFTAGVAGAPPKEFVAEYAVYFPDANDLNLKYLWVCSLVPDGDIAAFIEAVLGQSLPTEKGMQEAAETFQ